MSRNRILIALCSLFVAAAALAFAAPNGGKSKDANKTAAPPQERSEAVIIDERQPNAAEEEKRGGAIPLRVVYRQLFHHYVALKNKAAELESQGKNGATARHYYKREAKLSDKLERELERVAAKTDKEVEQLDKKAREVINQYRAQYPNGQMKKGETLPPAPPELQALQEEKNKAIMAGRDELRRAFGEDEFNRFEEFVRQNVASKMKPVRFDNPRPEIPGSPRKPELTNRKPSERILQ